MSRMKRTLNATKSSMVCERTILADGPLTRMRGLLGRRELPAGEGLLLRPAPAIHTAFMRFAIDAVFLDEDMRILRIAEQLRPWKAAAKRHARSVLELGAGEAQRLGIREGDQLLLVDPPAQESQPTPPAALATPATTTTPPPTTPATTTTPPPDAASDSELIAYRQTAAPLHDEQPMRVLVLSTDRRFREVVSLLFARRGCMVTVGDGSPGLSEHVEREHTEVVVIDAGRSPATAARIAAAVESLTRPVGIVMVDDRPEPTLPKLQMLPKWGSFEELFTAVEQAHAQRTDRPGLFQETANGAPS